MERSGVVIPTLNEEGNIENLIRNILELFGSMKVVIVDDQSKDLTVSIVQRLTEEFPSSVFLISREEKRNGLAGAYLEGYGLCISLGVSWIFQMDADGQHNPLDMPNLWKFRGHDRLVIGSRYCLGGSVKGWSMFRILVSKLGNVYFRILHKPRVRDCTGGFRLFDASALSDVWSLPPTSKGFTFHAETTYRWRAVGKEIFEAPITFCARKSGDSKMTFGSGFESIKQIALWKL